MTTRIVSTGIEGCIPRITYNALGCSPIGGSSHLCDCGMTMIRAQNNAVRSNRRACMKMSLNEPKSMSLPERRDATAALLGQFAASLAHDLRTPLMAIRMLVEVVRRSAP